MAYMNQDRKKLIAAALKLVVPADWKYTLAVRNHSTIVLTITQAPVDLITLNLRNKSDKNPDYLGLNTHYIDQEYAGELGQTFIKINDALNLVGTEGANFDKSDIMTDFFNVGWYVDISIGRWDSMFIHCVPAPKADKPAASSLAVKKAALATMCVKTKSGKTPPKLMKFDFKNADWYKAMSPGKKAAYTRSLMAKGIE